MSSPGRLRSLDGLRGVAAAIVLVHHSLLTFPSLADAYYGQSDRDQFSLAWLLSYTPLHALWAGKEAVYLFFILSGVVLTLPVLRDPSRFSWLAYYPKRIVRLYVPVVAAVIFGGLLTLAVARYSAPGLGEWMNARPAAYTDGGLAKDLTLVNGTSQVISPLWSLRWEVLFSLLLPVFVALALFARRLWWLKFAAVLALIAVGAATGSSWFFLLPMFAIGSLLVSEWDRLGRFFARFDEHRWAWPLTMLVALLLTTSTWTLLGLGLSSQVVDAAKAVPVAGVTLVVLIAGFYRPAQHVLETPVMAWLGTISFGLYLVHEPIVIAVRFATFPLPAWVGLLISVPLALVTATLFARFVEQPAHRLAIWTGSRTRELAVTT